MQPWSGFVVQWLAPLLGAARWITSLRALCHTFTLKLNITIQVTYVNTNFVFKDKQVSTLSYRILINEGIVLWIINYSHQSSKKKR
jgi:hypothetical protein